MSQTNLEKPLQEPADGVYNISVEAHGQWYAPGQKLVIPKKNLKGEFALTRTCSLKWDSITRIMSTVMISAGKKRALLLKRPAKHSFSKSVKKNSSVRIAEA